MKDCLDKIEQLIHQFSCNKIELLKIAHLQHTWHSGKPEVPAISVNIEVRNILRQAEHTCN